MSALENVNGDAPAEAPPPDGPPRGVRTMSIVRWGLVALTAVVAAVSIGSTVRTHLREGPKAAAAPARLYRCPMHPAIVQDHPGQCPICGMTLVLDPEEGGPPAARSGTGPAGLAPVDLTPERIQLVGMRTAPVARAPVGGELRAIGVVAASERGLAQIGVRFSGWVQKLAVSATGERVRRGQVLATVYSPEVLRAEQEMLVARGWGAPRADANGGVHEHDTLAAGLDVNARRRLELLGISGAEIDALLRNGKADEAVAIRSPVDGTVVAKNAVAGVAVQPGMVLFEVADLSQVWVNAEIFERDVARIHVGQKARFEPQSFPGETHAGKVQFLYPVVDASSRTLRLRLELKNKIDRDGPRLKPGMTGTVHLDLPAATGLTVPAEAVVETGDARYLFVAKGDGRFEPRTVTVGARVGDRVEITSGVSEGETVVTTGNFLVDSESRLRAAIEGQRR